MKLYHLCPLVVAATKQIQCRTVLMRQSLRWCQGWDSSFAVWVDFGAGGLEQRFRSGETRYPEEIPSYLYLSSSSEAMTLCWSFGWSPWGWSLMRVSAKGSYTCANKVPFSASPYANKCPCFANKCPCFANKCPSYANKCPSLPNKLSFAFLDSLLKICILAAGLLWSFFVVGPCGHATQ